MNNDNKQSRLKSPLFWIGMVCAAYAAFMSNASSIGVELPWYVGAIGTAFAAISTYCVANNPSDNSKF